MAIRERGEPVAGRVTSSSLWRDADFRKMWAALSISLVGSQITILGLPLIAALTLNASPFQMGLLAAAGRAPFLLISLPAGVWTDRLRRRPILIASDLGSALLLLSIPIATLAFGRLHFVQLCVVAFGIGALSVVGQVAHLAYVPTLIGRDQLVEGNTKLQVSYSAAETVGPGLGGLLIQLVSAPLAMLADAVSFVMSALLLRGIARREPVPIRQERPEPMVGAITAGMRALLGQPLVRPIILALTTASIFNNAVAALYVLYATRELGLNPLALGLIFTIGSLCTIPGALLAPSAARTFGVGWAIIGGWTLGATAGLLVPLAAGPAVAVIAILAAARALHGATDTVANIHQWCLYQTVTPDHLLGRATASQRFIVWGSGAVGALLGGALGSAWGLRSALLACAVGALVAPVWAIFSPLRRLREQPPSVDTPNPSAS